MCDLCRVLIWIVESLQLILTRLFLLTHHFQQTEKGRGKRGEAGEKTREKKGQMEVEDGGEKGSRRKSRRGGENLM